MRQAGGEGGRAVQAAPPCAPEPARRIALRMGRDALARLGGRPAAGRNESLVPACRDAPDCPGSSVRNKAEGLSGLNPFELPHCVAALVFAATSIVGAEICRRMTAGRAARTRPMPSANKA